MLPAHMSLLPHCYSVRKGGALYDTDCNGRIITDAIEKANTFNCYYSTVFSSEGNILHIPRENTGDPFTIDIKTIRRRIKAIGKTNQ